MVQRYDRDIVGLAPSAQAALPSNSMLGLVNAVETLSGAAGEILNTQAKVEAQQDANFLAKRTSQFKALSAEKTKATMLEYVDNPVEGTKVARERNKALWDDMMADAPSLNTQIEGEKFYNDFDAVAAVSLDNWQKKQVMENTISTLDL